MRETLEELAQVRKDKRLIYQRMEAAWRKVEGSDDYQDFKLYRKLMHSLEMEEAHLMSIIQATAAGMIDTFILESFPDEVDLAQDHARDVTVSHNLGHLVNVELNLN